MSQAENPRTFLRPRDGAMIGGVMAAFARHFDVDVSLLRGAAVLLVLVLVGVFFLLPGVSVFLAPALPAAVYALAWMLVPAE